MQRFLVQRSKLTDIAKRLECLFLFLQKLELFVSLVAICEAWRWARSGILGKRERELRHKANYACSHFQFGEWTRERASTRLSALYPIRDYPKNWQQCVKYRTIVQLFISFGMPHAQIVWEVQGNLTGQLSEGTGAPVFVSSSAVLLGQL